VASYVLSLQGTNPPNPKAPEGDFWKDGVKVEGNAPAKQDSVSVTKDTETVAVK
jgi:cytochrome c oxidase cbb3-type subunit 3